MCVTCHHILHTHPDFTEHLADLATNNAHKASPCEAYDASAFNISAAPDGGEILAIARKYSGEGVGEAAAEVEVEKGQNGKS